MPPRPPVCVPYDDRVATARPYTPTALPSRLARALAFAAIVVGGLCGGLIGWSVTDIQCGGGGRASKAAEVRDAPERDCAGWAAGGGLVGSVMGAGGVGVVAVLVLRAMGEWRRDLDVDLDTVPPPVAGNGSMGPRQRARTMRRNDSP